MSSVLPLFPTYFYALWLLITLLVAFMIVPVVLFLFSLSALGTRTWLSLLFGVLWIASLLYEFVLFYQGFADYPSAKAVFAVLALVAVAFNVVMDVVLIVAVTRPKHQEHWNA